MSVAEWTPSDTKRAQEIWAEYEAQNDLSSRKGQAAGIDPVSGRIWFGESASDIVAQMDSAGEFRPLYFVRVGKDWYVRKGARS
jgi:hypothetical protein